MNGNTFCFALTEIASLWLRQQSNNFPKYCLSFTQVTGGLDRVSRFANETFHVFLNSNFKL